MVMGIGTDLVDVSRIEKALSKHGDRFAKRILCDDELECFRESAKPVQFLAKHFALKEAVSKALGTGIAQGLSFQQMRVSKDNLGKPIVTLEGAAKARLAEMSARHLHVSLSDESGFVSAFAVISE